MLACLQDRDSSWLTEFEKLFYDSPQAGRRQKNSKCLLKYAVCVRVNDVLEVLHMKHNNGSGAVDTVPAPALKERTRALEDLVSKLKEL